jgi:hypothetical protein
MRIYKTPPILLRQSSERQKLPTKEPSRCSQMILFRRGAKWNGLCPVVQRNGRSGRVRVFVFVQVV